MLNPYFTTAGEFASKADIGTLSLDDRLEIVIKPRQVTNFSFDYKGLLFHCVFKRQSERAAIAMTCVLGHRPYSAEDRQRRININTVLNTANDNRFGKITIDRHERMIFNAFLIVEEVLTPILLVTLLTEAIVHNRALLELGCELAVLSPQDFREMN